MTTRPLLLLLAMAWSPAAFSGPVEDARYLLWTSQHEKAARALEPYLVEHPGDLAAHELYLEVRVIGMGEGAVARSEYAAWKAPEPALEASIRAALDRVSKGQHAAMDPNPLPSAVTARWVKYLTRHWKVEPDTMRAAMPFLWGLDAPIGEDADRLRTAALAIAAEGAKSTDPHWLEAARAATASADIPGMALVALERLVAADPGAWPGALEDDALRSVRRAARAVSAEVALARLDKLELKPGAVEAARLRHQLRAEQLDVLGRADERLAALHAASKADPSDPGAAIALAAAAIAAKKDLELAQEAVRAAIEGQLARRWSVAEAVPGLTWPEAYDRFYADRRVALGRLDNARRSLDRAMGGRTEAAAALPATADAAHHLTEAEDRQDRVGMRHLVEAVRLSTSQPDLAARARAALEARGAVFLGGLDATVAGWNEALGGPLDLRPLTDAPPARSLRGQPLTDFAMTLDGKATRLTEIPGVRVVAAIAGDCDGCPSFLRALDEELGSLDRSDLRALAVDVAGDGRSLDRMFEGAKVRMQVARTAGDLPDEIVGAGLPRLFVLSPEGVVLRDSGVAPDRAAIRDALTGALVESGLVVGQGEPPKSMFRVDPRYPVAAHWLGTPKASCLGQVLVLPDGQPFHVEISKCDEPFASAARTALSQWQWNAGATAATTLVQVDFADPKPRYAGLSQPACLWTANVAQDGTAHDVVTSCGPGVVVPGPLPWAETARVDTTQEAGVAIGNVRLPVPCEVAVDVGPQRLDLAPDPGTCPEAVRRDVVERVRRWSWDIGVGRTPPVRLVLRFEPPIL